MIAGDWSVLLLVVDGAVANCCQHIKFVRLQLSINFIDLVTIDHPGPTTLQTEYYIKILQTTRAMTNENCTGYNLTTFHGAVDLRTLSLQEVQAVILDHTLQDGPVELQPASFGVTSAQMDPAAIRTKIKSTMLCLAYQSICHMLFLKLCPGYSNQPHAALDHIHQVHMDCNGNAVSSSIQAYYQQFMSASWPFLSQQEYPISVCARFGDGLDPHLLTGFRHLFPQHSIVQPLNAALQGKCFASNA